MQNDQTVLGTIEPDVAERLVTRREAIRKGAAVSTVAAAGLAMASVPVALAALSRDAFAQAQPSVTDVLNFALILEIFENEFYKAVLGTSSSATQNAAFGPVRGQVPASALPALQLIQRHEAAHVAFLLANGATNGLNLNADSFDFTGARGAGNGPFARATTELAFLLAVAQGAEDTGVRAYKGQAANLMSNDAVLEAALRIHSVEARHAAKIRRLRRATGAPDVVKFSGTVAGGGAAAAGAGNIDPAPPAGAVSAFDAIYEDEENTTHAGVNVAQLSNLPAGIDAAAAASEAFDEPLTKDQVRAIVQPFFIPTIP
ncbi:MAG: ferritin-like domain-containing protein [Gemmatimonadota bacterium]|nr:ferritin-like domain-containing protein [Gemmatimonadota bacterium]